jgi:hypothetical protein
MSASEVKSLLEMVVVLLSQCRPRWFNAQRACHWTQGSRVQTRLKRQRIFREMIIRSTCSFGGEVKAPDPCTFLRHVKEQRKEREPSEI